MTSPHRAVTGNMLGSKAGKSRPKNETPQSKDSPQPSAIDEEGLICIRRLDKKIGTDPTQRDADQNFLKRHYGEISPAEMHSYFASSDGAVLNALARRRNDKNGRNTSS